MCSELRRVDVLESVVGPILSETQLDPDRLMVIGAEARDLLHSRGGHRFELRGTTDVDLALVLDDWDAFDVMRERFRMLGANGIRFLVDGHAVDVMPFGEVEEPTGTASPPSRGEHLVVFGFRDVYEAAGRLVLPSGEIRLPSVPGYAALKLRAWIDRSPFGEDKDARDLAAVLFWYLNDPQQEERVWEPGSEARLAARGWDVELLQAFHLGVDVGSILSPANRQDLAQQLRAAEPIDRRALDFGQPRLWTHDGERRAALFEQVIQGVETQADTL
jgi:predicted nucleotidyltransferase